MNVWRDPHIYVAIVDCCRKHTLNCHRMRPALFQVLCEIKEKTGNHWYLYLFMAFSCDYFPVDLVFTEVYSSHSTPNVYIGWKHLSESCSNLLSLCISFTVTSYTSSLLTSGLDLIYDQHLSLLSAVHWCHLLIIELFQSPLLIPGTLCQAISHPKPSLPVFCSRQHFSCWFPWLL